MTNDTPNTDAGSSESPETLIFDRQQRNMTDICYDPNYDPKDNPLEGILSPSHRKLMQAAFTPEKMDEVLVTGFTNALPSSIPLIKGIEWILRSNGNFTTRVNQERITIALLAAASQTSNLALHMYIVLADENILKEEKAGEKLDEVELSVSNIANILVLTGMYAGVDKLSGGLGILVGTLKELTKICEKAIAYKKKKEYEQQNVPGNEKWDLTTDRDYPLTPKKVADQLSNLFQPQLHDQADSHELMEHIADLNARLKKIEEQGQPSEPKKESRDRKEAPEEAEA